VPRTAAARRLFAAAVLVCTAAAAGGTSAAPPLVAVDIGHTLQAPGARSARGRDEFSFNRALARALVAALGSRGIATLLINDDGHIASLEARPALAAAAGADLLLSIHHDSVSRDELQRWQWNGHQEHYNDQWHGHSLFVSARNPEPQSSLMCASAMGAWLQRRGFAATDKNARRRPWADPLDAVHWYDNLIVLYRSRQPAVLFEAGVIRNRDEELLLADPAYQARMADALATAVAACVQVLRAGLR
jgi:N-acetylmuramoyl-L-alanine amidase